jgi:hypothetical protein
MRRLFLMLLLLFGIFVFTSGPSYADSIYLQKDTLISGVIIIKNKQGAKVGTLRKDTLIPDNFMIYDKEGNKVGEVKKDSLIPGQYILKLNEGTIKRLHFEVRNETDGS